MFLEILIVDTFWISSGFKSFIFNICFAS